MSPIAIVVPDALNAQKAELETTLARIANEEEKLAVQRKDIQAALNNITTSIVILSRQPVLVATPAAATGAPESRCRQRPGLRIADGLRRSAQAKAAAKAAHKERFPCLKLPHRPPDAQVVSPRA